MKGGCGRNDDQGQKPRIDSWLIGFAPVENPQIAWAVVVEEGGYGSRTSATIAGQLLLKAKDLGLITIPQTQKPLRWPARIGEGKKGRSEHFCDILLSGWAMVQGFGLYKTL